MLFNTKNAVIAASIIVIALLAGIGLIFLESPKQEKETKKPVTTETRETTVQSTNKTTSKPKERTTEEELELLVKNMSLDQKIGQLFLARVPETNQIEDLKAYHLGGYLLFGRDIDGETKDSLKDKITSYQEASDVPLLIASDEEGGTVTRVSRNQNIIADSFKSPQALYAEGGMEAILKDIDYKSDALKDLGIHTGLYPVADVSTNKESFIYDRTLGVGVDETSDYISQVVKELKKDQLGSTLKHFPGSGDNHDAHAEIVTDTRSMEDINQTAIPPFKAGIDAGADSVLVSHNIIQAIDSEKPASISPKVHQLLRKDLGFTGVVMTDDMDMVGLSDFISQEEAALSALQAGNDLILSSTYSTQIPVIKKAVKEGSYPEKDLDQSVTRILTWKYNLGVINL